MSPLSSRPEL
jgi:Tol biopolymer transport system component